jgi:hypothetical protein
MGATPRFAISVCSAVVVTFPTVQNILFSLRSRRLSDSILDGIHFYRTGILIRVNALNPHDSDDPLKRFEPIDANHV